MPPNTTAEVFLPDGGAPAVVGSGRHRFTCTIQEPKPVEKPFVLELPDAEENA